MLNDFSNLNILEYYGIKLAIPDQVYSPKEDTDLLVDFLINWIRNFDKLNHESSLNSPIRILEMGTGPGTISLIIISTLLKLQIKFFQVGVDINPMAIEAAIYNAKFNNVEKFAHFFHGSYFKPLNIDELKMPYDLIIFNPPYLQSEPDIINGSNRQLIDLAWDGGPNGNEVLLEFLNHLSPYLKKNGELIFITSSLVDQKVIQHALEIQNVKILEKKTQHIFFENIILYHCKKY